MTAYKEFQSIFQFHEGVDMTRVRTRGMKALLPVILLFAAAATAAEKQEVDLATSVIRSEICGGYNPLNNSEEELNKAAIENSRMKLRHLMLQKSTGRELKVCYALHVLEAQIKAVRRNVSRSAHASNRAQEHLAVLLKRQTELARLFRKIQNPKAKSGGPAIKSQSVRVKTNQTPSAVEAKRLFVFLKTDQMPSAAEAKRLFVFLETISRLEKEEQKQHIPIIYQNIYLPLWYFSMGSATPWQPLDSEEQRLSPEELADSIQAHKNGAWWRLIWLSQKASLDILRKNQESLVPLVKADITSKKKSNRKRALKVISDLKLIDQFDSVLHIFETDADLSDRAMHTLRDLRDPRAIAPIVKKNPGLRAFECLRNLQAGNAANPSIIAILQSKDPEARWRAAYILTESADPKLIPHFIRLAKDKEGRVRWTAALMGHFLAKKYPQAVRPTLVKLLSDPDSRVRSQTAMYFAERKDPVCAQTLLEMLKNTSIKALGRSHIVKAIHTLTGSNFGYHIGSDAWKPTTENNKRAIKRFEEWINKNAANEPDASNAKPMRK